MKLKSLSEKLLKEMCKCYSENHNKTFNFSFFKKLYPQTDDEFLSDALAVLKHDEFINIFYADNSPYLITLMVSGILASDENTMIKKGYELFKEIKAIL